MAKDDKKTTTTTTPAGPTPEQLMALLQADPTMLARLMGAQKASGDTVIGSLPHPVSCKLVWSDGTETTHGLALKALETGKNVLYNANGRIGDQRAPFQLGLNVTLIANEKGKPVTDYAKRVAMIGVTVPAGVVPGNFKKAE